MGKGVRRRRGVLGPRGSSRAVDSIDLSPDWLMGVIVVMPGIPVYFWLARQRGQVLSSDGQFRSR